MKTIYLDNSATTRPMPAVVQAMVASMEQAYYNPSSLYAQAVSVEKGMSACRAAIQQELGTGQVLFTSGGTEANNLAILGSLAVTREKGKVLYSAGEHSSVREACAAAETMGFTPVELPLTPDGLLDMEAACQALTPDTRLICLMHINNETGAIQPIAALAKLRDTRCPQAGLHVDAVQGFLRHPLDSKGLGVDSVSLSAHKVHGPKGMGALWLRERAKLSPRVYGGGQEGALRPGTENTPGIAALAAAIQHYPRENNMRALKLRLYRRLAEGVPALRVNGPKPDTEAASDHILNVSFAPVRGQTMLHALEGEGVLVGNGSACSSKAVKISRVLKAMGVPQADGECAIRFSLNPFLTEEEIDLAADRVIKCYNQLKGFVRR